MEIRFSSTVKFGRTSPSLVCYGVGDFTPGVELMKKLVQYRGNESICRQRAVFDVENRWHWLAQAEMWAHKVQDEIASQLRERNAARATGVAKAVRPKAAA